MQNDSFSRQILTEDDLCSLYLSDPDRIIRNALSKDPIAFASNLELQNVPNISTYEQLNMSRKEFDRQNQQTWFMPKEYFDLDIAKYVLDLCKSEAELQRVGEELLLYQERNLFPLLQYLKYLVDTMRQHNIVWGVGRGSSVASYVLYLLGVHKIDSIYYDLPINEFLK